MYQLAFGAMLSRTFDYDKKTLFGTVTESKSVFKKCKFKSKPLPLSEWEANDYQKVKETKPEIIKYCLDIFIPFLPKLLELDEEVTNKQSDKKVN